MRSICFLACQHPSPQPSPAFGRGSVVRTQICLDTDAYEGGGDTQDALATLNHSISHRSPISRFTTVFF